MKYQEEVYESPAIEAVEIEVEQFFASSETFTGGGEGAGGIN